MMSSWRARPRPRESSFTPSLLSTTASRLVVGASICARNLLERSGGVNGRYLQARPRQRGARAVSPLPIMGSAYQGQQHVEGFLLHSSRLNAS
jgi:hypothetical protein